MLILWSSALLTVLLVLHLHGQVLFGSGLLTPAIQVAATSLLEGTTPVDWTGRWEGPEKPQVWLTELVKKRLALLKWQSSSSRGALLEEPRSLGDLFNPATFVNALRQQTARHLGTAIDRVRMVCMWDSKRGEGLTNFARKFECPLCCQLTGLLLQGASFSNGSLQESPSDGSEMSITADVMIGFVAKDNKANPYNSQATMAVPVYFSASREEFLVELTMPIADESDAKKWTLAGVSLFLNEGE